MPLLKLIWAIGPLGVDFIVLAILSIFWSFRREKSSRLIGASAGSYFLEVDLSTFPLAYLLFIS